MANNFHQSNTTINDLPSLAIEYILSQLSYYQLLQLRLVSRHWYSIVKEYLIRADRNFFLNLTNYRVQWVAVKELVENCNHQSMIKSESILNNSSKKLRTIPRMSPRLHHLACYVDNYMYVYGGCISLTTAYNDLWRFDTTTKRWSRIVAEGTLPLPRLFGSLSLYNRYEHVGSSQTRKQYLVLFGGIVFNNNLQPPTFDDQDRLLKTIHLFDIELNRWTLIQIKGSIELKSCHHTATIVGDELIIAGNGHSYVNERPIDINDAATSLYVFDLRKHYWRCQRTVGSMFSASIMNSTRVIPTMATPAMILQSAKELFCSRTRAIPNSFIMDDHHILFISHVSNYSQQASPTAFLLKITSRCNRWPNCVQCQYQQINNNNDDNNNDNDQPEWQWIPINLSNVEPDLKCGNICIIKNRLLAYLSVKNRYFYQSSKLNNNNNNQNQNPQSSSSSSLSLNSSLKQFEKRSMMHERRIEKLDYYKRYYEDRIYRNNNNNNNNNNNQQQQQQLSQSNNHQQQQHRQNYNMMINYNVTQKITLQLHLLDISEVITHRRIHKLRPKRSMDYTVAPNAFNYYSLCSTSESLILFGGYFIDEMYKDIQNRLFLLVSKPDSCIN